MTDYLGSKADDDDLATQGDQVAVDSWILVGYTGGAPAFQNSWANYGDGWHWAAFYKDPVGVVRLRGLVKSGTVNTAIFTLPSGYRPPVDHYFAALCDTKLTMVEIDTNGAVFIYPNGSNGWLSLAGIEFKT